MSALRIFITGVILGVTAFFVKKYIDEIEENKIKTQKGKLISDIWFQRLRRKARYPRRRWCRRKCRKLWRRFWGWKLKLHEKYIRRSRSFYRYCRAFTYCVRRWRRGEISNKCTLSCARAGAHFWQSSGSNNSSRRDSLSDKQWGGAGKKLEKSQKSKLFSD